MIKWFEKVICICIKFCLFDIFKEFFFGRYMVLYINLDFVIVVLNLNFFYLLFLICFCLYY